MCIIEGYHVENQPIFQIWQTLTLLPQLLSQFDFITGKYTKWSSLKDLVLIYPIYYFKIVVERYRYRRLDAVVSKTTNSSEHHQPKYSYTQYIIQTSNDNIADRQRVVFTSWSSQVFHTNPHGCQTNFLMKRWKIKRCSITLLIGSKNVLGCYVNCVFTLVSDRITRTKMPLIGVQ